MENNYYEAIQTLTNDGYVILEVNASFGHLYFAVYKWQESYFNTAQSVDFNTLEGVNVTNFLSNKSALYKNARELLQHFENELQDGIIVRLEFSKSIEWFKWASPNKASINGFK